MLFTMLARMPPHYRILLGFCTCLVELVLMELTLQDAAHGIKIDGWTIGFLALCLLGIVSDMFQIHLGLADLVVESQSGSTKRVC